MKLVSDRSCILPNWLAQRTEFLRLLGVGLLIFLVVISALPLPSRAASGPIEEHLEAPKIWEEQALSTWALPVAGINATPNHRSEAEYYTAPAVDVRTYPVYHPDREPAGYMDWLRAQEPKPLIAPEEIKSDADWARLGQRVFDELDLASFRSDDPRAINALRDRENLKTSSATQSSDGQFPIYRWVAEARGRVRLSTSACAGCHMRVQPNGTLLGGPPRNFVQERVAFAIMAAQTLKSDEPGRPLPPAEKNYIFYGVPWLKDDIHARFRGMSEADLRAFARNVLPGTNARVNGSPYFITKIPDLIGVKDRRYLDAPQSRTGGHRSLRRAGFGRRRLLDRPASISERPTTPPDLPLLRHRTVCAWTVHLLAGAAAEPQPVRRTRAPRRKSFPRRRLREMPRAAGLYEQQAHARRRIRRAR